MWHRPAWLPMHPNTQTINALQATSVPVKASQQQTTMNQIEFDAGMSLCCLAAQLSHRCWPKVGAAIAFSAGCASNSGWGSAPSRPMAMPSCLNAVPTHETPPAGMETSPQFDREC